MRITVLGGKRARPVLNSECATGQAATRAVYKESAYPKYWRAGVRYRRGAAEVGQCVADNSDDAVRVSQGKAGTRRLGKAGPM